MELLIYMVIAVLVAFRLYNALGHTKGWEDDSGCVDVFVQDLSPKQHGEYKVDRNNTKVEQKIMNLPINISSVSRDSLIKLRDMDYSFSLEKFLVGAELAFETVFGAYVACDITSLESFVSIDLQKDLKEKIKKSQEGSLVNKSALICVGPILLESVSIDGTLAKIRLCFETEQIIVIEDKDGKVVHGDPKMKVKMKDIWQLERNVKSEDPNWFLTSMT